MNDPTNVKESSFEGLGRVHALLETQMSSLSLIQKAFADRQSIRSPRNRCMSSGVFLEIRGKILCESSLGRFLHESGMTRSLVRHLMLTRQQIYHHRLHTTLHLMIAPQYHTRSDCNYTE